MSDPQEELRSYYEMRISEIDARLRQSIVCTGELAAKDTNSLRTMTMHELGAFKELWRSEHIALQMKLDSALISIQTAINKAETASDRRFDSVNEFRAVLTDQQRGLMPRAEFDVLLRGNVGRIDELNMRLVALSATVLGNKEGITRGWGFAVGILGFILTVLNIIMIILK